MANDSGSADFPTAGTGICHGYRSPVPLDGLNRNAWSHVAQTQRGLFRASFTTGVAGQEREIHNPNSWSPPAGTLAPLTNRS